MYLSVPSKLHTKSGKRNIGFFVESRSSRFRRYASHILLHLDVLLRKTSSVPSAISTDMSVPCHCPQPSVFLRFWSSPRSISNSQLHTLPCFHLCPIYLVLFKGSYFLMEGISHLEGGFTLRCLQRLSLPDLATLPCRWSTTDTPVVRPSRSSRTKDSSSQISSARAG